jgi:hypothetical protein
MSATATDNTIQALGLNSGLASNTGGNGGGYGGLGTASGTIAYGSGTAVYDSTCLWYPSWSYPVYVTSPARPIKLTLSEIDKLRKMAKGDKAIQAILEKFTDQIEIAVDFK